MWEESISATKIQHFNGYQVNTELMSLANKDCHFMHCLPAHRGVEVTDDVMDWPQSLIYQQAKNRMVTARWVFLLLFGW
jgi:ornithine carbamoyltransferase